MVKKEERTGAQWAILEPLIPETVWRMDVRLDFGVGGVMFQAMTSRTWSSRFFG